MPKGGKKNSRKRVVEEAAEYFCNSCGTKLGTPNGVAIHQTVVHPKSTFKCKKNYCTCCFETEAELAMHKNIHMGKRKCTRCRVVLVAVEAVAEEAVEEVLVAVEAVEEVAEDAVEEVLAAVEAVAEDAVEEVLAAVEEVAEDAVEVALEM